MRIIYALNWPKWPPDNDSNFSVLHLLLLGHSMVDDWRTSQIWMRGSTLFLFLTLTLSPSDHLEGQIFGMLPPKTTASPDQAKIIQIRGNWVISLWLKVNYSMAGDNVAREATTSKRRRFELLLKEKTPFYLIHLAHTKYRLVNITSPFSQLSSHADFNQSPIRKISPYSETCEMSSRLPTFSATHWVWKTESFFWFDQELWNDAVVRSSDVIRYCRTNLEIGNG